MARVFRFGKPIGSGGMGIVHIAERVDANGDTIGDKLVQKTLLPVFAENQHVVARFKKEVRFLDEMDHPHVIPVVGRNLSARPPWFVMPWAESTLLDQISQHANDVDWVVETFTAVLEGVAYAHVEAKVIHRDLKPENVLMVGGVPKVSDFGLGKSLDPDATRLTRTNVEMGTEGYMAPEQGLDAAHVGPAADVYALGKILGEMLTTRRPERDRPRLVEFPPDFRGFIDRCTQDNPKDRYADAADALAAFQLLISGTGATGAVSGDLEDQIKTWERKPPESEQSGTEAIIQTLISRAEDEEFYFRTVPRLPLGLVSQMIEEQPSQFTQILRTYNDHIQGDLPFEYCDVVANFYRHIFLETDDLEPRQLVLERLFDLGPSHNRWHVGDVVAELLSKIEDKPAIELVSKVIEKQPRNARWFKPYVDEVEVPPRIREAFESSD